MKTGRTYRVAGSLETGVLDEREVTGMKKVTGKPPSGTNE
jgi:hypothetical protein